MWNQMEIKWNQMLPTEDFSWELFLTIPGICHNHHYRWLCKRNDEYLAQLFKIQGWDLVKVEETHNNRYQEEANTHLKLEEFPW